MTREITPQGKTAEIKVFDNDGGSQVAKFWENGKRKSWESYGSDGLCWYITKYNKQGVPTEGIAFANGSNIIMSEQTLYQSNGNPKLTKLFNDNGILEEVNYYDEQANKLYTEIYSEDGKTVEAIREYDDTGQQIKYRSVIS